LKCRFFFYIVLFFFSHSVFSQSDDYEVVEHDDWVLKKDKGGIQVYTRWIEAEDNRKARQLHAVMFVDASLSSSIKALEDPEQVIVWLNRTKEYEVFNFIDETNWCAYTRFNIPWPLDDQDLITRNIVSSDSLKKIVHVELTASPELLPEKKNVQRMKHFDGSWDFKDLGNGKTQIDYFIFTKTKPFLPRWIIDPIVENGFWTTFNDLRKVILKNEKNVSLQEKARK